MARGLRSQRTRIGHFDDARVPREVRVASRARCRFVQRVPLQVLRVLERRATPFYRAQPDGATRLLQLSRDARADELHRNGDGAWGGGLGRHAERRRDPGGCSGGGGDAAGAGFCDAFYDPAFATADHGSLRGSYASVAHAEAGPAGLATEITSAPEFGSCTVQRVAGSLLGRSLSPDDDPLLASLTDSFTKSGFHMRGLVAAILRSDAYKKANNSHSPPSDAPPTSMAPNDGNHGAMQ